MTEPVQPELAGETEPLNILLITSDQQHFSTLGTVNPLISTPALDELAAQGTLFTRAYCNNPLCTPSRSTIITGQYPSWHGAWTIGTKLDEGIPTVGDYLQAAGYRTNLIGKAHFQPLASVPEQTSLECMPTLRDLEFWRTFGETQGSWYGFGHVETARNHADEYLVGQHYALWMEEKGLHHWRDFFGSWPLVAGEAGREHHWDLPADLHYTTWTAERTIAAIDRDLDDGKPFFTWASFHDPHPPYLVPEPWASMYDPAEMPIEDFTPPTTQDMPPHFALTQQPEPDFSAYQETPHRNHGFHSHLKSPEQLRGDMAIYYGMVSFMDEQIGRILRHLEVRGVAERTLVVFSTDHGHFFGQHGLTAKGAFHYEDLLRVPFIVRYPGHVPAGQVSDSLQALVDLAPTFLTAAGLPVPGQMQGVNQLPVWEGQRSAARDMVIVENRHQPSAVHLRTYVTERYKLTLYRGQRYGELFDLQADPHETRNLWAEPQAQELRAKLMQEALQAELEREPTRYARIALA